jgi:hypothetical protein
MTRPTERVIGHLTGVRRTAGGWIALCPSHQDRLRSLKVAEADDGKVLLHCHAGCRTQDVVASIGLSMRDLFP